MKCGRSMAMTMVFKLECENFQNIFWLRWSNPEHVILRGNATAHRYVIQKLLFRGLFKFYDSCSIVGGATEMIIVQRHNSPKTSYLNGNNCLLFLNQDCTIFLYYWLINFSILEIWNKMLNQLFQGLQKTISGGNAKEKRLETLNTSYFWWSTHNKR